MGDGDCGTTLAQGARAVQAGCAQGYPLNDAAATMEALAASIAHAMGGSSGALYQIFFIALAGELGVVTAWLFPGKGLEPGLACPALRHNTRNLRLLSAKGFTMQL